MRSVSLLSVSLAALAGMTADSVRSFGRAGFIGNAAAMRIDGNESTFHYPNHSAKRDAPRAGDKLRRKMAKGKLGLATLR